MSKKVICKDLEGKEYEVEADKLRFRPAVYGLIIENGKILLSKQWDGYDFPGGAVELGETLEEALKREVKEETGLSVELTGLIDCKMGFFKTPDENNFVQSILMYFLCSKTGGELTTEFLDEGEKDSLQLPEWVNLDEFKNLKFMSTVDCSDIVAKAREMVKG